MKGECWKVGRIVWRFIIWKSIACLKDFEGSLLHITSNYKRIVRDSHYKGAGMSKGFWLDSFAQARHAPMDTLMDLESDTS